MVDTETSSRAFDLLVSWAQLNELEVDVKINNGFLINVKSNGPKPNLVAVKRSEMEEAVAATIKKYEASHVG